MAAATIGISPNGRFVPPQWGGPLNKEDYAALAESWITREIADAAMLRRVDTFDGRDIVGQKGGRDCAGVLFSYYWPSEERAHCHRIRRDHPEWTEKNGKLKSNAKYLAAPGSAKGICLELATRGAHVKLVNLPEDCGVNGIDDLLAKWGPARVLELIKASVSGAHLEVVLPPQFKLRPDGMFRVTTRGERLSQVQLTNYQATIATNIRLDDGAETKREFEVESELMGRKSAIHDLCLGIRKHGLADRADGIGRDHVS